MKFPYHDILLSPYHPTVHCKLSVVPINKVASNSTFVCAVYVSVFGHTDTHYNKQSLSNLCPLDLT